MNAKAIRIFAASFLFALSGYAFAQTVQQVAQLKDSGWDGYSLYGDAVAIDGDTIVVGNTIGSGNTPSSALVYVKPSTGWQNMTETAQLLPSDGVPHSQFGSAVAITGNVIAVSDYSANNNQGKIYVYLKPAGGWSGTLTETAQLTVSNNTGFALGTHLAMDSQGTIFASAPLDGVNGSIYVFVPPATGWQSSSETAVLTTSHGTALFLGSQCLVAYDGTVVAQASGWPNGYAKELYGAAFMWVKPASGWANASEETALFTDAGHQQQDLLSDGIAFDGTNLILGAPGRNNVEGIAFAYKEPKSGWASTSTFAATLTAPDLQTKYALGNSASLTPVFTLVSIDGYGYGKELYEGAVAFYPPPPFTGKIVEPITIVTDPQQHRLATFGQINAAQDNIAVVSAYDENPPAVYVFQVQ